MATLLLCSSLLFLPLLISAFHLAETQSCIGVNYGSVADNLPPPAATAGLLKSTIIGKVRLRNADCAIIEALAGTGIAIVVGIPNSDIQNLACDPEAATQWVNSNVLPYYPSSNITLITVGDEVTTSSDQGLISQLLPAMRNIQAAVKSAPVGCNIRVSTVHSMAVLSQSCPSSSGLFNPALHDTLQGLLEFLKEDGSPFAIKPYPYLEYESNPTPETLAFCSFQPNSGRIDSATGITYTNMFDAQVDAVRSALNAMCFKEIEIMVAETGWPHCGDCNEVGTSIENARVYNGNLLEHLKSMAGTPLMPGKSVDTFIFELYDEDQKPSSGSQRAFGLFKPDLSMIYDVGLLKPTPQTPTSPTGPCGGDAQCYQTPANPTGPCGGDAQCHQTPPNPTGPCAGDAQWQANPGYACEKVIHCDTTDPYGGCFEQNTVSSQPDPASLSYILVTVLAFILVGMPER